MIQKIYKELLIIIVIFVSAWALLAMLEPEPEMDLALSIEKEYEIAEALLDQTLEELGGISDREDLKVIIDSIASRLTLAQTDGRFEYTFHLVASDEINAFASMGGNVFVTEGIMEFCKNPEELAAVIAHELGHVEHRHVISGLAKDLGIAVLFAIATGGEPGILTEVMEHSLSNSFSREDESEADVHGLELMEEARLKPSHMATVLLRIKKISSEDMDIMPTFLSTHPELADRIDRAIEYQLKEGFEEVQFQMDWPVNENVEL